jgi:hypothetical protein
MIYRIAIQYAIVAAMAAAGAWTVQGWRADAALAELRTEYATAQFQALEEAHAQTIRLQEKADAAARKSAARQSALANDVAAARSELERLRDELAATRSHLPDASCSSVRDYAATANELFGVCADRLEGLAGKAQGHAIDSLNLQQAWPK